MILSVSFGIGLSSLLLLDDMMFKSKSSFETLSPTFTAIFSIFPSIVDGISTLDLSLSIVTIGSFFLTSCPSLTRSSTTSTSSNSPMSGTNNF